MVCLGVRHSQPSWQKRNSATHSLRIKLVPHCFAYSSIARARGPQLVPGQARTTNGRQTTERDFTPGSPDYGKLSVQTLLEVAAAFGLPLWIDMPEWEDRLGLIRDVPSSKTKRHSFDAERLKNLARFPRAFATGSRAPIPVVNPIVDLSYFRRIKAENKSPSQESFAKTTAGNVDGASFAVSVA